jgi:O-antigen/teichoic acid export membrane protein
MIEKIDIIINLPRLLKAHIPANSMRARFASGIAWTVVGSLLRQGTNFLVTIFVARIIGVTDFGILAIIQSTVYVVADFGQAGIGLSTTKYIASFRSTDRQRAGRLIGFSLIFTSICALIVGLSVFAFASRISVTLLPGSNLTAELKLASFWIVFEMINNLQLRILGGLEAFRKSASVVFCQAIGLLLFVTVGAYKGGEIGTLIALTAVSVIGAIVGQVILVRECNRLDICISCRHLWKERGILRMSAMVWISSIAMNTTNWLVGILLARHPSGLTEMGLFNASNRFQNILLFLSLKICDVMVPILANLQSEGNRQRFAKVVISMGLITVSLTAAGAILLVAFSDRLMSWYGPAFALGSGVLKIAAVGCIVISAWSVTTAVLWAAEKSRLMLLLDVFRGALLVGICMRGMATSAQNLAMAYLMSYSIGLIFVFIALFRYLRTPWSSDKLSLQAET